jgi:cytosine/adenosine deaminase-related metal-dependent hydrolase
MTDIETQNKIIPAKPVTHRAEWVVVETNNILQDGYVVVQDGFITEIGKGSKTLDGPIVDHGNGVILPGLINAHIHLELCALKNRVASQNGFLSWVQELLAQRSGFEPETLLQEAALGIDQLLSSGCIAAGDVSTMGITQELFARSPLLGIWFQEFLGRHPDNKTLTCRKGPRQSFSLAGHAPHTTSPELLTRLKTLSLKAKLRFSIHLAESIEEVEFLARGKGPWADFLSERGIDFSSWGVGRNLSPVRYADQIRLLHSGTIAVHVIRADETDFEILRKNGSSVCLCLRSNQTLHGTLPDVRSMLKHNINLCLGTDSLASVDTLSMFDEMKFAATHFPEISPADILKMATGNGAAALELDGLTGTLRPGELGSFLYLDLPAGNVKQLMESIVHASFQGPVNRIPA